MSEVIICRCWEPKGPCWLSCTSPCLPSEIKEEEKEKLVSSLLFCFSFFVDNNKSTFYCCYIVSHKLEPQRGSFLLLCEAGERNVAKWGHGHPCGQQSMDEINGHCAQQRTKTSRKCCRFWSANNWNQSQCGTGSQSVSCFFAFHKYLKTQIFVRK